MRKLTLSGLILLLVGLAGCGDDDPVRPGSGRTLQVPVQFEKIQQAIDAAEPGDVVLVAPGTYTDSVEAENMLGGKILVCIDLKSGVDVRSATDRTGNAVLRGNPLNPVVNCTDVDSTASLIGFTITGGRTGIAGGRTSVNIVNCVIEENHSLSDFGAGGGMYWDFSSPTITNCVLADNSAPFGGGAVFANDSQPVLTNCVFSGNLAHTTGNTPGTGGGLSISNGCLAELTNCLFVANQADSLGGAIEVHQSTVAMLNCDFYGNISGGMGGAVCVNYGGRVDMTNGQVKDNSATLAGGGFYFKSMDTWLFAQFYQIRNNSAPNGPDGYLQGSLETAEVTLKCCDIDPGMWVGSITLDDEGCE